MLKWYLFWNKWNINQSSYIKLWCIQEILCIDIFYRLFYPSSFAINRLNSELLPRPIPTFIHPLKSHFFLQNCTSWQKVLKWMKRALHTEEIKEVNKNDPKSMDHIKLEKCSFILAVGHGWPLTNWMVIPKKKIRMVIPKKKIRWCWTPKVDMQEVFFYLTLSKKI